MRLIDADAFAADFRAEAEKHKREIGGLFAEMYADVIDNRPTIDAVPVVRCKDCKYYHDFETHYDCSNGYGIDYPRPDDFCSYGVRKENTND